MPDYRVFGVVEAKAPHPVKEVRICLIWSNATLGQGIQTGCGWQILLMYPWETDWYIAPLLLMYTVSDIFGAVHADAP